MKERFGWLATVALLALWIAVMTAIYLACSAQSVPCDPQTDVAHCQPELGTYQR